MPNYEKRIKETIETLKSGLFEREECLKLVLLSMFANANGLKRLPKWYKE